MKRLWQLTGIAAFWLGWLAIRPTIRATRRTRVIITAGDQVLLVKAWLGPGQWILPGGGIRQGEDAAAAAVREVQEETGLVLEASRLKKVHTMLANDHGLRFPCEVFSIELPEALAVKPVKKDVTEIAWMSRHDLRDLSPFTRQLLAS